MSSRHLVQFEHNVVRCKDLVGLGQSIGGLTRGLVDSSDLYRAALVQIVAALDAYIHSVVLDRGVDILIGRLSVSQPSQKIGLNFAAIQEIVAANNPIDLELSARTHLAQRLALETFQKSEQIASGLAMVGVGRVWSQAFPVNPSDIKTALGPIIQRRNSVVHACDVDPLAPGSVIPLTDSDTLAAIATIERIVQAIDPLV